MGIFNKEGKRKPRKIMLAGPSGIGKTTIAEWISETYSIPFLNGSVRYLLKDKELGTHQEMLSRDNNTLYEEEYQILNLRNKLYKDQESYVTDRSYLDNAAYFLLKHSAVQPACEIEHFISGMVSRLIVSQPDLIILFTLEPDDLHNWFTEDDGKRITSNYFQIHVSELMKLSLKLVGYSENRSLEYITSNRFIGNRLDLSKPYIEGTIQNIYGSTELLIIPSLKLEERKHIIKNYL